MPTMILWMIIISFGILCVVGVCLTEEDKGLMVIFALIFFLLSFMVAHNDGEGQFTKVLPGEIYDLTYKIVGDKIIVTDKPGEKIKIISPDMITSLPDGRVIIVK